MIVPFEQELYTFRYLPKDSHGRKLFFFPGGNVAYRRTALDPIEYFDPEMRSGEDIDASMRLWRQGEFFSNPRANVTHTSNLGFLKILSQWLQYAIFAVRLTKKHSGGGLEFLLGISDNQLGGMKFRLLYYRPSRIGIFVYFTPFLLMNAALWAGLISNISGFTTGFWLSLMVVVFSGLIYLKSDFRIQNLTLRQRIAFTGLRFMINTIMLYVSLYEGLKTGILYINYEKD
jgi:cellulose synthase/poly-beta-1,6-N-acetylglucosamine synthase-like glycosyltransferase